MIQASQITLTQALCLPLLLIGLVWCSNALALSLGKPQVESLIGQTLDIKIPIAGITAPESLRLLTHDSQLYAKANSQYTPLQERLLIELVLTTGKPYIAISSIGSVSSKVFNLAIGIADGTSETIQKYTIRLSSPSPIKLTKKQLSAAEVLLRLLNSISLETGLSQAEVLGQMQQMISYNATPIYAKRIVFKLAAPQIDGEFISGMRNLLTKPDKKALDTALQQSPPVVAVSKLLFEDPQSSVLKKLLRYARISSLKDDGNITQRLSFMKERVAILENQVIQLRQVLKEQSIKPEPKPKPPSKLITFLRDPWNPSYLFMRSFWALIASVCGGLAVTLLFMQYLKIPRRRREAAQRKAMLPGQRELEKELGLSNIPTVSDPSNNADDEIDSKINLASMYIEMDDYVSAHQELDAAIRKGNDAQIKRAKELKATMKPGANGVSP